MKKVFFAAYEVDATLAAGLTIPAGAGAMTAAAGRYDASRVSRAALDAMSSGDALNLPGLAADVAARATHLSPAVRAKTAARAWRVSAAVEIARGSSSSFS